MSDIATIAQAVAVILACWAIISGVGAWKREFIGKRRIELAETILAKFFEIKDAIAFIRSPWANIEEGKTREKGPAESEAESELLDRGYVVVERYSKKEEIFAEFNVLKYQFMATFGSETEEIFINTNKVLNSIFSSARMLSKHYWQRQGRVKMEANEFQKHLDEMHRHEGVFWDMFNEEDEIRVQLNDIQKELEKVTKPCFEEPMKTYSIFTKKWFENA